MPTFFPVAFCCCQAAFIAAAWLERKFAEFEVWIEYTPYPPCMCYHTPRIEALIQAFSLGCGMILLHARCSIYFSHYGFLSRAHKL